MALFGKKPLEKLVALYKSLSDEEKEQFEEAVGETVEVAEEAVEAEEVIEVVEGEAEEEAEEVSESEEVSEAEDNSEVETEETNVDEEVQDERVEDISAGLDARLKTLEEKFEQLLSEMNAESEEFGISGSGKTSVDSVEQDTRLRDVKRSLGGY